MKGKAETQRKNIRRHLKTKMNKCKVNWSKHQWHFYGLLSQYKFLNIMMKFSSTSAPSLHIFHTSQMSQNPLWSTQKHHVWFKVPHLFHLEHREEAQQCESEVRKVKMKEWKIGKWKPLWSCLEVQCSIWGSWQGERCLEPSFKVTLQGDLCDQKSDFNIRLKKTHSKHKKEQGTLRNY